MISFVRIHIQEKTFGLASSNTVVAKKRNSRQPERGIIYERRIMNVFQKARLNMQLDSVNRPKLELSLYKPLRSSFKAVYDFALKARQGRRSRSGGE